MWTCSNCGESVEDDFDACWKCGTTWDGVANPQFQAVTSPVEAHVAADVTNIANPIACVRCSQALSFVGRKRFHEGANWGALGELGELFVKKEHFDVYVCPSCGRVEFFVDGIGEEFRPH